MKVGHGFPAVGAVVDDQAVAGVGSEKPLGFRDFPARHQQMAQKGCIVRLRGADAGNDPLGNDENMNRRLGTDVPEGEALIILVDDVRGDLAGDDFFEQGHF